MGDEGKTASVSYARDIRPLFREGDIESMRRARQLDLASHDAVAGSAEAILGRLADGTMPCDGAWPADRVDLFRQWIAGGKQP